MSAPAWWHQSVVYQVYPRSFQDSNGDGVGDLNGLRRRLPYLQDLGVDLVWLCPTYASPHDDNGYDISDYQSVDPQFGTLDDLDALIAEAGARGIRFFLDLVVNHTSDEHAWFAESRFSKSSPKRDWYLWKPANPDGSPPTDWPSIFGGSVWEWDEATGEYYFHTFSRKQPDLNWENPEVREAVYAMMHWWADRGIAGFRVDAITFIKKNLDWPKTLNLRPGALSPLEGGCCNQPGILDFLREMRDRVLRPRGLVTVAEAPGVTPEELDAFAGPDGVFSMILTFDHVDVDLRPDTPAVYHPWTLPQWKRALTQWQDRIHEWIGLYLENHDQVRSVSKFGAPGRWSDASAKTLAVWTFLMRGTPFVYQGQELGQPNHRFTAMDQFDDLQSRNLARDARKAGRREDEVLAYLNRRSRDQARLPLPWSSGAPNHGFSEGRPWITLADLPPGGAADDQWNRSDSVWRLFRDLIRLRRSEAVFAEGSFAELAPGSEVLGGYRRTLGQAGATIWCNFTDRVQTLPEEPAGRVVLHTGPTAPAPGALGPWEAAVWMTGRGT